MTAATPDDHGGYDRTGTYSPFGSIEEPGGGFPQRFLPSPFPFPSDDLGDRFAALTARWERECQLWRSFGARRSPLGRRYGPSDIAELRASHFGGSRQTLRGLIEGYSARAGRNLSLREMATMTAVGSTFIEVDWTGLNAVPYLLDPNAAAIYLNASPPDAETMADLRLPYDHVLLALGAPFHFKPESGWWNPETVARIAASARHSIAQLAERNLSLADNVQPLMEMLYRHGGQVNGILLSADAEGRLCDEIVWMVATDGGDPAEEGVYTVIEGRISRSPLAPLVHSLAAAVAWGPWKAPDPATAALVPDDREGIAAVAKRGAIRRKAKHADLHGVHVVVLRPRSPRAGKRTGEAGGRTVLPHLRRRHWRNVRVATRDESGAIVGDVHGVHGVDWLYEGRLILPTVVNGGLGEPRPTVYCIPEPQDLHDGDHTVPEPEDDPS